MTTSLGLLARSMFLLCVLVLLAAGFLLAWFTSWRADKLASLNSESELEKTDQGTVEYSARGEGSAVLVFHGAPGGYDQAMLVGSYFGEGDFHIVAPSRPGYLRTPLTTGVTPEEQADALADLVDRLAISRVAILARSCGAPAAVQFALRHPKKVWALVLISAVTAKSSFHGEPPRTEPGSLVLDKLGGDLGAWLFFEAAEKDPSRVLARIVDAENNGSSLQRQSLMGYILKDSDQLAWLQSLIGTFVPLSTREAGIRNDLVQIRALADLPFEKISTPMLIVHGTADNLVPFSEAEAISRRMPGAILFPVQGAGHLVEIGPWAAGVQSRIGDFLRQYSGRPSPP